MKRSMNIAMVLILAFLFAGNVGYAQKDKKEKKKEKVTKVTIIKEIMDEDGNIKIETTVKTGDDAEKMEWTDEEGETIHIKSKEGMIFIKEDGEEHVIIKKGDKSGKLIEIHEEVEVEDDGEHKVIRIRKKGGGEDVDIEWEGAGELPDEIKEKLEKEGIELHFLDKDKNVWIHEAPSKNKALLGVMIGKEIEVKSENGKEEVVENGNDKGVLVNEIIEGSAAEEAGLQADDIITSIDGTTIKNDEELLDKLSAYKPGDVITVGYLRDGKSKKTKATLKKAEHRTLEVIHEDHDVHEGHEKHMKKDKDVIIIKKKKEKKKEKEE
ncbi:MAG: PDZ domain-containing protein [Bacteroidetes bacterium]|nr:PDZ domain-containing protein [Bacteroidota bacterium]